MHNYFDLNVITLDRLISERDTMLSSAGEGEYFEIGRRALEIILMSARVCEKPHYPNILDVGCGYGRVLRWLSAQYKYANIVACDLDHAAVNFCSQRFGAEGVYSNPELDLPQFNDRFDLVWCGSLLTHLPLETWPRVIDHFVRWTRDCGVIIISLQGRFFASAIARGQTNISENVDKKSLIDTFARNGSAYEPYFESESGQYGVSVTSPSYLMSILERMPGLIVRSSMEQAWGIQDVVVLYKKNGYFEAFF